MCKPRLRAPFVAGSPPKTILGSSISKSLLGILAGPGKIEMARERALQTETTRSACELSLTLSLARAGKAMGFPWVVLAVVLTNGKHHCLCAFCKAVLV